MVKDTANPDPGVEYESVAADARRQAIANRILTLMHFRDEATYEAVMGDGNGIDLERFNRLNRAYATEFLRMNREVEVQVVDGPTYAAWVGERENDCVAKREFQDTARMLKGRQALMAIGLGSIARQARKVVSAADELVSAWADGDEIRFGEAVEFALLGGGDKDFEAAFGKIVGTHGAETAQAFGGRLYDCVETAPASGGGWTEILTFPVHLASSAAPVETESLARDLAGSGFLRSDQRGKFIGGWRKAADVTALSPSAMRNLLADLVAGREPVSVPVATEEETSEGGVFVLLGHAVSDPAFGVVDHNASDRDEADRLTAFVRWRDALFEPMPGIVAAMTVVPPSGIEAEAALHADEDGVVPLDMGEIEDFVAMACEEARGESVVCEPRVHDKPPGMELTLRTKSGRFLDSRLILAGEIPCSFEAFPRRLAAIVELIDVGKASEPKSSIGESRMGATRMGFRVIRGGLS